MSADNDLTIWRWFRDMVDERPEIVAAADNLLRNIGSLKEE